MTITLDPCAWLVYSRGARMRGWSLEKMISFILRAEDLAFEDRGYLVEHEESERLEAKRKAEKRTSELN